MTFTTGSGRPAGGPYFSSNSANTGCQSLRTVSDSTGDRPRTIRHWRGTGPGKASAHARISAVPGGTPNPAATAALHSARNCAGQWAWSRARKSATSALGHVPLPACAAAPIAACHHCVRRIGLHDLTEVVDELSLEARLLVTEMVSQDTSEGQSG